MLKVLRPLEGNENNTKTLIELAKNRKNEYEEMCKKFMDLPDLIPKEHFVVMNNPRKPGGGVVVSIQKFIGHNIKDIFNTPTEEIQNICRENPTFQKELKKFIKINTQMYQEKGEIIDFLGPNNISLIQTPEGEPHIIFIDPHHILSNDSKNTEEKEAFEDDKKRLEVLENLAIAV